MLHYAVVFFVIALIAAMLGFRGVAGLSAQIGWLFAIVAVVFLTLALLGGRAIGANLVSDRDVAAPVSAPADSNDTLP
jgi:uncharacterized membrane protein YtjA (UPF0391 family)